MFQIEKYGERMGDFLPSFKTLRFLQLSSHGSFNHLPPIDTSIPHSQIYRNQIHSLSPDYQLKQQLTLYLRFLQKYGDFMDETFETIRPRSNWLLCWNLLNFVAIFICFIQTLFIIFIISRIQGEWDRKFAQLSYILGTILLLDMLLVRPRVSISQSGQMIRSHSQLLDRYLTKLFIWDLVAIIILFLDSLTITTFPYIRLIVFVKGFTFLQIKGQISIRFLGNPKLSFCYRLIRIVSFAFFFTFLYGSIYAFLDIYYYQQKGEYYQNRMLWINGSTKLHMVDFYKNFEWYVWFEIGVFMVLQMVRGCGYGTPTPRNPPSQLFYNIAALIMIALFTYYTKVFIDMVVVPSQHQTKLNKDYVCLLQTVSHQSEMQTHKSVSFNLFNKLWKHQNVLDFLKIIEEGMSQKLLQEFNYSFKNYFACRLGFLTQIIAGKHEQSFIFELTQIVKVKSLFSSQVICRVNDIVKEQIYVSGSARVIQSRPQIDYQQFLGKWAIFGMRECFVDQKSLFHFQAKISGIVKYIEKRDLLQIMKKYKQIYQRFFHKMQAIKLGEISTQIIELNCCLCDEYHLSERCPSLRHQQKNQLSVLFERSQSSEAYFVSNKAKIHPQSYNNLTLKFGVQEKELKKKPRESQQFQSLSNKRQLYLRKRPDRQKLRHLVSQSTIQIDQYSPTLSNYTNFNL